MKLRDLAIHEPAPTLPPAVAGSFGRNMLLPPDEAVRRLSDVLALDEASTSRARLSTCNRLVPLAPRGKKFRRNVEAWLVGFARDDEVLLLTAPPSEESLRHLVFFPETFRRLVEGFGVLQSPDFGIAGMVFPRRVESAQNDLSLPHPWQRAVPFFTHGNGDWDVFMDGGEGVGCYFHEDGVVRHVADTLGQWFDLRYADCLC
jgi:hypothetical protein